MIGYVNCLYHGVDVHNPGEWVGGLGVLRNGVADVVEYLVLDLPCDVLKGRKSGVLAVPAVHVDFQFLFITVSMPTWL